MPPALENPHALWFVLTAALAGLAYAFVRKELRVRAVLFGALLIGSLILIWPPYERNGQPGKIKLGLDLKGGIHLVLQVVVADALNATIDDAVQTARDQAIRKGINFSAASRVSATSFSVEGVEPARVKDMRDILRDFFRTEWEVREPGEGRFLVQMTELQQRRIKERTVGEAIRTLERRLAIVLDGSVASAPSIHGQISSEGQITGRFTAQQTLELAQVLSAGALPATLRYQQQLTVGASLGRDSIRSGVLASAAGMGFITLFMLVYYRLSGLNAVVALAANLAILLAFMAYTGATLTLPGIAGVILTIGVGVDTNVLVFERIREELRNGKTVRLAVQNGFDRVWITILDTHATALIAAGFLFQFGTGPIKGFALTLVIGLVANVFASFFVSKFLFEWVLGKRQVATLSI